MENKHKKKSFVVYTDTIDKIKRLNNEQIGKLFIAMLEYHSKGEVPEIDDQCVGVMFDNILNTMQHNIEKWEEISKKRSEAGKKGGAKKGNQNARKKPAESPKQETPKVEQSSEDNTYLDYLEYTDSFRQVEKPRRSMSLSNHLGFDGVEEVNIF